MVKDQNKKVPARRGKEPVITVNAVFAGIQTDRQAFIDLIAQKQAVDKSQADIDNNQLQEYNIGTSKTQDTQRNGG